MRNLIKNGSVLIALAITIAACGSQLVEFPNEGTGGKQSSSNITSSSTTSSTASSTISSTASSTSSSTSSSNSSSSTNSSSSSSSSSSGNCEQKVEILPIDLGTSGDFAILAKAGVSTVPASAITGDVGVSPIAATGITGFSLILDPSGTFSISTQVVGKVYAADYISPTPSKMTTAIGDMQTAFVSGSGRAATITELGAGDISGLTLVPGVYKWGTGLLAASNVYLRGGCADVWIMQIAQDFTIKSGVNIFLSGETLAKNVFWIVSGSVDIGTTAHVEGDILSMTKIAFHTGSSINGRLLAQTAITLEQSVITKP